MESNTLILSTQEENDPQTGKIIAKNSQEGEREIKHPLPFGFFFQDQDLMYQPEAKGNQESPAPIFICSRL